MANETAQCFLQYRERYILGVISSLDVNSHEQENDTKD